ncbi:penicillin-binding transpeptidase domain-containing protein [Nonomuraea muscovyensis]|uniref:Peptidoglycan glycosyltransferase n=1 Tax=Nonomuraea muscovyensis TaxID=1124761 RepID=A0A7X0CC79_9ACTN|nr:penicillin-binding transpeptidase domain-containing protein [Nonomuraea muscovyensis]MBB6351480.1 peptidoglycan glycosyltransferase [Nonomuraea muscovyensis]
MNIPLRRVAVTCAVLLFALLANVTYLQAFGPRDLVADRRNERTLLARYAHPRGDILTHEGRVLATSAATDTGPFRHRRVYPGGRMYAPVTGHFSLHRAAGLERAEDAVLSGSHPSVRVRTLVRDGRPEGADVRLTIRHRVQQAAYQSLARAGRPGAAVAIDPVTGAILALASYPSYDPAGHAVQDAGTVDAVDRLLRGDPAQPMLNRALRRAYPPGPASEVVTAAAALASGEYTIASPITARAGEVAPPLSLPAGSPGPGERSCGNGRPTLAHAFRLSCAAAFAALRVQLGPDLLRDQAEAFGFNAADLTVPLRVAASTFPAGLDRSGTALSAAGLPDRATPLMIAMLSAAVANGGVAMRPYLVEEVRLPDGSIINRAGPRPYRTAMSPALAGQLTILMATATRPDLALQGVEVAAKPGPDVVTAFAPATAPEVAVGVVLEPGTAPAAPVARAILRAALS